MGICTVQLVDVTLSFHIEITYGHMYSAVDVILRISFHMIIMYGHMYITVGDPVI